MSDVKPMSFTDDEAKKWIQTALSDGVLSVKFTKKDGTERTMKCTLHESVVPVVESKENRKENTDALAVWDIDINEWRSFRYDTIKEVEFV